MDRGTSVDAADLSRLLESFLVARWGKEVVQRPRAMNGTGPWSTTETVPEVLRDMTWVTFSDAAQPRGVGIRDLGVQARVRTYLVAYLRTAGRIELHHWRHDSGSGWQYIKEQTLRTECVTPGPTSR